MSIIVDVHGFRHVFDAVRQVPDPAPRPGENPDREAVHLIVPGKGKATALASILDALRTLAEGQALTGVIVLADTGDVSGTTTGELPGTAADIAELLHSAFPEPGLRIVVAASGPGARPVAEPRPAGDQPTREKPTGGQPGAAAAESPTPANSLERVGR